MAADTPVPMSLIITNPSLSGRSLRAMVISRKPDGTFAHDPEVDHDIAIGDGQTTIVSLPLGARLVLREATDPPMAATMAGHPAVMGHAAEDRPLTLAEEVRGNTLATMATRTVAEEEELRALSARRVVPAAVPAATMGPLSPAEDARRSALLAKPDRTEYENTILASLEARARP